MLRTTSQEHPAPPTPCPACRSRDVHATDKTTSAATYWRCATCGEVWNPGRRDTSTYRPFPHR